MELLHTIKQILNSNDPRSTSIPCLYQLTMLCGNHSTMLAFGKQLFYIPLGLSCQKTSYFKYNWIRIIGTHMGSFPKTGKKKERKLNPVFPGTDLTHTTNCT